MDQLHPHVCSSNYFFLIAHLMGMPSSCTRETRLSCMFKTQELNNNLKDDCLTSHILRKHNVSVNMIWKAALQIVKYVTCFSPSHTAESSSGVMSAYAPICGCCLDGPMKSLLKRNCCVGYSSANIAQTPVQAVRVGQRWQSWADAPEQSVRECDIVLSVDAASVSTYTFFLGSILQT